MGRVIIGRGFLIDMAKGEFVCPICTCPNDETWLHKYEKSKSHIVTIKCQGCKRKLQATIDLVGDAIVWEKVLSNKP